MATSTPKQHITMSNRRTNGKPTTAKMQCSCHSIHLTQTFISPNQRTEKALDIINNNIHGNHLQMRSELQARHTDVANVVNEYTNCM